MTALRSDREQLAGGVQPLHLVDERGQLAASSSVRRSAA